VVNPVPLLILDIDGTVREGKQDALGRFVNGPEDVRVFPAAVARMREWKTKGGRMIGVSNQGGVALGYVTRERVTAAMEETNRQCGYIMDHILFCPHAPWDGAP
jgi:D-glycero-D-manno-heptose 1,7-bisphosphate phosphatase